MKFLFLYTVNDYNLLCYVTQNILLTVFLQTGGSCAGQVWTSQGTGMKMFCTVIFKKYIGKKQIITHLFFQSNF